MAMTIFTVQIKTKTRYLSLYRFRLEDQGQEHYFQIVELAVWLEPSHPHLSGFKLFKLKILNVENKASIVFEFKNKAKNRMDF